jgi:hypothetical protein
MILPIKAYIFLLPGEPQLLLHHPDYWRGEQQFASKLYSAMQKIVIFLTLFLVAAQAKLLLSFYGSKLAPKVLSEPVGDEWVAQAEYSPASEHISNFAQLSVKTSSKFADNDQAFAAGFLEGYLTAESVHQHYANMVCQVDCSGYVSPELKDFFSKHDEWTRQQIQAHPDCPFWSHIG